MVGASGLPAEIPAGDRCHLPGYLEDGTTASIQSGGALTLTLDGRVYAHTLSANVTAWSVTAPTAPICASVVLILIQDSTPRTMVWPASWRWPEGLVPVMPTASGARLELVLRSTPSGLIHASAAEFKTG